MRVTIVLSDNVVLVDFKALNTLDLSELDPGIHAIQWNNDAGHIEYTDGRANEIITDTLLFDDIVARHTEAIYAIEHPVFTLDDAKTRKKEEIELGRDRACVGNVSALDHIWQADEKSQALLNKAIMNVLAGLPLTPVWRDIDNYDMPITDISQLVAIAGAIGAQTQNAYITSWGLKAQVNAATTTDQVAAVVW